MTIPQIPAELVERMVAHLRECAEVHNIRPTTPTAKRLYEEMKALVAAQPAPVESWKCAALIGQGQEPQDCNWPHCGCDPKATEVLTALDEHGYDLVDRHAVAQPAPVGGGRP